MNTLKQQEQLLLKSLCDKYNLPTNLITILVKTAEKNMHENLTNAEKRTDYIGLVNYHSKRKE